MGPITRRAIAATRCLLVEAAWRILRSKDPESAALRAWTLRIAARRGKPIPVVALARRLAGIVYGMWRDACRTMAGRSACRVVRGSRRPGTLGPALQDRWRTGLAERPPRPLARDERI